MTCDVTPHHLALSDEWLAGSRAWAWDAAGGDTSADRRLPLDRSAPPYASVLRVNPPLRTPADVLACLAAVADGTADAIATDHAPHRTVDKDVEFGLAANGISGIETAVGLVLEAVAAGRLSLATALAGLSSGPARVLGPNAPIAPGLTEGAPADLVVIDAGDRWPVSADTLLSRGKNSPLLGRDLPGRVLLTLASGRVAWADGEAFEDRP